MDGFLASVVTGTLLLLGTVGLAFWGSTGKAFLAAVMLALSVTRMAARVLSQGALVALTGAQLVVDFVLPYLPEGLYGYLVWPTAALTIGLMSTVMCGSMTAFYRRTVEMTYCFRALASLCRGGVHLACMTQARVHSLAAVQITRPGAEPGHKRATPKVAAAPNDSEDDDDEDAEDGAPGPQRQPPDPRRGLPQHRTAEVDSAYGTVPPTARGVQPAVVLGQPLGGSHGVQALRDFARWQPPGATTNLDKAPAPAAPGTLVVCVCGRGHAAFDAFCPSCGRQIPGGGGQGPPLPTGGPPQGGGGRCGQSLSGPLAGALSGGGGGV